MFKGFRDFLLRGNVVDLAVAVVIGAAFGAVVDGFIKAFVDPLLLLALSATGATALETAMVGIFPIGVFLSALITFIVKAAVIYVVLVAPMAAMAARKAAAPAAPAAPPADVQLLTEIRDLLRQR